MEHSAVVTLLSYLAGNIAIQQGKSVDLAVMLAHASLHDAAEVLCSDVVTPVKKANAVLQREFERLEKAAEDKLIQTLPEELQDAVAIAFAPGGYEQSLVKACDTYSAYIKCKLEVAAGNGLEFQDALSKMERVVAQVKSDFPEIDALDKWFGNGLGHSVDKLLAGGNDD
ncbi:protein YbaA [Klebsiella pneumoniae subsp. pneumoniae UKKV901664]|nr:protein YbaA [Klebsiella pneumoniae subsp. pneumoniae UKKV901664]